MAKGSSAPEAVATSNASTRLWLATHDNRIRVDRQHRAGGRPGTSDVAIDHPDPDIDLRGCEPAAPEPVI
jgi:hypothetical protein